MTNTFTRLTAMIAVTIVAACSSATMPDVQDMAGTSAFELANPELNEASGLAASLRDSDRLWLHNDSGGQARLFAATTTGDDLGTVQIDGVVNVDWEDLDIYNDNGTPMLLIADVGDNNATRPVVQLHQLAEPEQTGGSSAVATLTVSYEDGPRDCEAVAVDATERAVYLLTKRDTPPRLYRVALDGLDGPTSTRVATFLGTVDTIPPPTDEDLADDPMFGMNRDQPTAMSFTDDDQTAIVVTYKDAYRYTRQPDQAWIDAFARTPQAIDLPQLAQTEAGTVTGDGATLYVASEQRPAPLVRIVLSEAGADQP